MAAGITALAALLAPRPDWLVLTGAGLSTASGIPAYRGPDGVRHGPAPLQGAAFRASAALRRRYWARSMLGWPRLAAAAPNAAHAALAELEASGRIGAVVTQNVDGLHQRAGSLKLIELHGNIHAVRCLACGARLARAALQLLLEQANPGLAGAGALPAPDGDARLAADAWDDFQVPACPHCAGTLQPDVVFFGDGVPAARSAAAQQALLQAGALLVAGSSLTVHSGFRLCKAAFEAGKPVVAINLGRTRADHLLSMKVALGVEQALPALAALLR